METAASMLTHRKPETRLRACHATAQLALVYHKVAADDALASRVGILEDRLERADLLPPA